MVFYYVIWGRCNLKRSRRTVIFLPVYKISSLKITPPKTPNYGQFSYPLPNIVSFYLKKNRLEFQFRSRDFSFNLFPVWLPYCWRSWSAIVSIHTSTINAPKKGAYKVCMNIKKNKYITVEIWNNKCTRNVRSLHFYRTESRRFFSDWHILIKRSLSNMILSQNKRSVALKL